jgi:NADH-quinone oxidoreductase subunit M
MWGPLSKAVNATITDLDSREIAVMVPLVALMIFMGLYPKPLLNRMQPAVGALLNRVQSAEARMNAPQHRMLAGFADFEHRNHQMKKSPSAN